MKIQQRPNRGQSWQEDKQLKIKGQVNYCFIGGTVSAISGGKFANGAYTAAFQHLFNAEATAKAKAMLAQVSMNGEESSLSMIEQVER